MPSATIARDTDGSAWNLIKNGVAILIFLLIIPTIAETPERYIMDKPATVSTVSRGTQPEMRIMEVTAYTINDETMDGLGITASGKRAVVGVTVAAGPEYPFGTKIAIEGVGIRVVEDRGGAIGNGKLDLLMETKKEALKFGRQRLRVTVLERKE